MSNRHGPNLGVHGNAWKNVLVGVNGVSAAVETGNLPWVSAFGRGSGPTVIQLQYSQDGVNWYGVVPGVATNGDWSIDALSAARYHRLKCGTGRTLTATICAKG